MFSVLLPLVTAPYLSRTVGTYGVGLYSKVDMISTMCRLIARGALLSVAVVLLLLPAMLLLLDKFIVHTTLDMKTAR